MPACIACRSPDVESVCSGAYMAESSEVIYLGSSPVVECPSCGTKPLRCSESFCECGPECCFTVCPTAVPTSSGAGLAFVAAILLALGAGTLHARAGRR